MEHHLTYGGKFPIDLALMIALLACSLQVSNGGYVCYYGSRVLWVADNKLLPSRSVVFGTFRKIRLSFNIKPFLSAYSMIAPGKYFLAQSCCERGQKINVILYKFLIQTVSSSFTELYLKSHSKLPSLEKSVNKLK